MPTRLLAIDIDGTLLTSERVPHPLNIEAIRRAQENGITVVLASGRIASSIRKFSDELGLDGAMICSNGAHVQGNHGVELLHVDLGEQAKNLTLDYTAEVGVHVSAYTRDELFFVGESKWCEIYRQRVRTVMPEITTAEHVRQMQLLKLILIDEPENIQRHRRALEGILTTDLAAMTESEPDYLEVLSPKANKGLGLQVLSESLGILQAETAAIGDYLNDLEMIQWAGIGGAMGNALDEVKAAANVRVPTNNEAGVARFIDYLIEQNEREA